MKKLIVLSAALGMLFVGTLDPAQAQSYKVIVNSSNAVSSMPRSQVAKLFLKKTTRWSDGSSVAPVDLPKSSPVRAAFSEDVLGKSVLAVDSLWRKNIFSGRAVPPLEKGSDSDVIAYVSQHPGAVGYVSSAASLGGVKELTVAR